MNNKSILHFWIIRIFEILRCSGFCLFIYTVFYPSVSTPLIWNGATCHPWSYAVILYQGRNIGTNMGTNMIYILRKLSEACKLTTRRRILRRWSELAFPRRDHLVILRRPNTLVSNIHRGPRQWVESVATKMRREDNSTKHFGLADFFFPGRSELFCFWVDSAVSFEMLKLGRFRCVFDSPSKNSIIPHHQVHISFWPSSIHIWSSWWCKP